MLTHLTDFPDRLSPMLVKELRQGMRARSFTLLFLIFQLLLCFILITAGASYTADGAGTFASGVIFGLFGFSVLFIQPMRGISALSSEITGNTLEMMALTRLSATRIVFGKWIALVSQSALILVSIIPYLILRYFFGGMLLVAELVFLVVMFLTSMALTAVTVGISGNKAKFIKLLPMIGMVLLLLYVPSFLFFGMYSGGSSLVSNFTLATWESCLGILAYLCFIAYFGWCALSFGISSIAPDAENHSTLRRLIALALTLITAAIGLHPDMKYEVLLLIFAAIISPAIITALLEPYILLPPICTPFLKRGILGKAASLFLYPGWPAGVFFTTLLAFITLGGIALCIFTKSSISFDPEIATGSLACFGTVLFAALCTTLLFKQERKRFIVFLLTLLFSTLITFGGAAINSIPGNDGFLWLLAWNPLTLLNMLNDSAFDPDALLLAAILTTSVYLAALLILATRAFLRYRPILREAENSLTPPLSPNP